MRSRFFYLGILSLCGFVTSFGAHIVATNLPAYAETVGAGALMIGLLIAVYDFAELFDVRCPTCGQGSRCGRFNIPFAAI